MTDFVFDEIKIKREIFKYCNKVNELYKLGNVESSYNKPVQDLIQLFGCKIVDVSGGRREDAGENIDLAIWHLDEDINDIPAFGGVEVKKVKGIDKRANEQILIEAKKFGNVILTDNLQWQFYHENEEKMYNGFALLKQNEEGVFVVDEDKIPLFMQSIKDYILTAPKNIKSASKLAYYMAQHAQTIKVIIHGILSADNTKPMFNELSALFNKLKAELLPDLNIETFSDMYAQTITYGLFIARYNDKTLNDFSRGEALTNLSKESVLLKEFFQHITTTNIIHPTLDKTIDKLCNLFLICDLQKLLNEYEKRDPIIHFYEDFLGYYDKEAKKNFGAYYTPVQVVRYMVNAVDEILINDFHLKNGLANNDTFDIKIQSNPYQDGKKLKTEKVIAVPQVAILDPACGTGTFMSEIIKLVKEKYFSGSNAVFYKKWLEDKNGLLSRLVGFEIMMTSYVVAHLKLRRTIYETLSDTSLDNIKTNIFLTNTLAEPKSIVEKNSQATFFDFSGAINEEAEQADKWKARRPIKVIIGNPPYNYTSKNIYDISSYFTETDGVEKLKERNPKGLNDDYVKFISFAEKHIEKDKKGVLAFITNNGYLDNVTFRGMRASLLRTFDKIYILNLHGNSLKQEKCLDGTMDENVFDIRVGVAIIFAIKTTTNNSWGKVYYDEILGKREDKFEKLENGKFTFSEINIDKDTALFLPQKNKSKNAYDLGISIRDLFNDFTTGIDSGNDVFALETNKNKIVEKIEKINNTFNDDEVVKLLGKLYSGQTVKKLKEDINDKRGAIIKVSYRPFEDKWTYYSGLSSGWLSRPRDKTIMESASSSNNYSLVTQKQSNKDWCDIFISNNIIDSHYIGAKTYTFPLYIKKDEMLGWESNINLTQYNNLVKNLKNKPTDGQVFDYCYGLLYDKKYREKFNELLKLDYPKVKKPDNDTEFNKYSNAGKKLRELHLLRTNVFKELNLEITENQNLLIEQVKYTGGKIYINKETAISEISENVWNYHIGGYQVIDKWLKSHKGEELDYDKFNHLKKIVGIIEETIKIQEEMDKN